MRILQIRTIICTTDLWGKLSTSLKNLGLVLGLAPFLFSCEDPSTIGIETDENNLNFQIYHKKFVLPASIVVRDSILTSNSGRLLVGQETDPLFGVTEATAFGQPVLSRSPTTNENSEFDSLVLNLKLDYVYGGETLDDLNRLRVHRLIEPIDNLENYYSSDQLAYRQDPIGDLAFRYAFDDDETASVNLDTTYRVHLDDSLGIEFMNKILDEDDSTFNSNPGWLEYFRGIALVAGPGYNSVSGFNIFHETTNMVLHTHFVDDNGITVNQTVTFSLQNGGHFNNVKADRTGTGLSDVTEKHVEYTPSDDLFRVQSGLGLVTKVDFSEFIAFTDTIDFMVLNLAQLTVGPLEDAGNYESALSPIIFYYSDSLNRVSVTNFGALRAIQQDSPAADPTGFELPIQARYFEPENWYSEPVTSYFQALYNGEITDSEVLIAPEFLQDQTTVDRFVVSPENIFLEVYYTGVNNNQESN